MQYLLDTNIYINFYDRAYRFEYFPSFWDAFEKVLNQYVVLPQIVVDEACKSDEFNDWLGAVDNSMNEPLSLWERGWGEGSKRLKNRNFIS